MAICKVTILSIIWLKYWKFQAENMVTGNREYVYKIQKNKWGTIRYEWAEGGIIIEDVYESQLTEYNG